MKKLITVLIGALIITTLLACSSGFQSGDPGPQGIQGPKGEAGLPGNDGAPGAPAPTPVVTPEQDDIDALLQDENNYRLIQGQTQLSAGLSCTVQAVSSGSWLSNSSPGYNAGQGVLVLTGTSYPYLYKGSFNQPDGPAGPNNLLPTAIQPLFLSNNYKISCSGQIVVRDTGYYTFSMASDDGSILTVNGTQVINNDGNHGITEKTGTILLRRGVRSFSILYAQSGGGNFGLTLKANNATISGSYFAH
jgi:hypothetical protein